ncbi:methyltransferase domain-containing protein [Candidatus Kaiserbacteria bacterium]|nr:methyltransferase domain-containing protein [Candidatus Kaiserbacteria bacterium]
MTKQVNKDAYEFLPYCYPDRWASYYYQLREVIKLRPSSVLEIGTGDGVFKRYLKNNTDITYTNLDIAADLSPDIVGTVEKIPLPDKSVDVVVAFEVLEHIPFERFETALSELARVARKAVVISLPHFGPPVKFSMKVPFLPEIRLAFKIPFPKKHIFNGEHYWEIGKRGFSVSHIRSVIKKYFSIEQEFIPFENQYHHFFVLSLNFKEQK